MQINRRWFQRIFLTVLIEPHMKKLLVFISTICLLQLSYAQKEGAPKYAEIIDQSLLQKHLAIIASDEMEGRETGTEGQRKAAAYIQDFFKEIGLKQPDNANDYQQMYPLYQDRIDKVKLSVNGKEALFGTDYLVSLMNSSAGKFEGKEVVFVGYGIDDLKYSDYKNLHVKGKMVAFFMGEPKANGQYFLGDAAGRSSSWTYPGIPDKLAAAKQHGAIGAFVISPTASSFSSRSVENAKETAVYFPKADSRNYKLPFVQLNHNFAQKILGASVSEYIATATTHAAFKPTDYKIVKTKVEYKLKMNRKTVMASNVLGLVEGSDKKEEYVFITAHYDHLGIRNGVVYNGADDDGSGTVSIMAIAKAFAQAKADGHGPRRTVVIMAVSGEEKGLWGSEYYSDHPIYPLDKTSVDLNIDMIGRVDTERKKDDTLNYVYVVGNDKISSDLPVISEGVNEKYTKLVLDYKFDDPKDPNRIYFRSDHYNFARKGVPVLFYYDGMLKSDYHQPTDDIEKINFSLMQKRAQLVFNTAWEMANREEMLKRDIPLSTATR